MADIVKAIDYVLAWEDPGNTGKITVDTGGRTRYGIAERFHPELTNCLFYSSMGTVAALQIARGIYEKTYADPLCISDILNQDIANKLLSLGVNIGIVPAAKMLQEAAFRKINPAAKCDGRIGPLTLHALEQQDPEKVLDELRELAEAYYSNLIAQNPKLAIYRVGWMRRAEA